MMRNLLDKDNTFGVVTGSRGLVMLILDICVCVSGGGARRVLGAKVKFYCVCTFND